MTHPRCAPSLLILVLFSACDTASSRDGPDAGTQGDPVAPSLAGSVFLDDEDADVDTSATLELRFRQSSSDVATFTQSHEIDAGDFFPFDYQIGGGIADEADDWELKVWLSWEDDPGDGPVPGEPSASASFSVSECPTPCELEEDVTIDYSTTE